MRIMGRKIPDWITDPKIRGQFAEINKHIATLRAVHRKLTSAAHARGLAENETDLLQQGMAAIDRLNKEFKVLTPSMAEYLMKKLASG